MNFIISRFSKDNFWNLVACFGILLTVFISAQIGSILCLVCAFTITPYILTRFNKVRYLEDGTCVNSRGHSLNDTAFIHILLIITLNIVLAAFSNAYGFFDFLLGFPQKFKFTVFIGCIMFWPFLYCIFKNYPISILFNVTSWRKNTRASVSSTINSSDRIMRCNPMTNSYAHSSSRNDFITNPIYSHLPQNVYHSSHNRRY